MILNSKGIRFPSYVESQFVGMQRTGLEKATALLVVDIPMKHCFLATKQLKLTPEIQ
ncbi:MAG: hypothetical protein SAK29_18470 [Scytonema sp. PMC 1069.18]|nr:hypothetical protein [Scytonema sp. PMC 1069.18]MEC4885084.1 hypothetical protein [Scytonema sp. PMC 1070.18]